MFGLPRVELGIVTSFTILEVHLDDTATDQLDLTGFLLFEVVAGAVDDAERSMRKKRFDEYPAIGVELRQSLMADPVTARREQLQAVLHVLLEMLENLVV